jgi:hypothetical protein
VQATHFMRNRTGIVFQENFILLSKIFVKNFPSAVRSAALAV